MCVCVCGSLSSLSQAGVASLCTLNLLALDRRCLVAAFQPQGCKQLCDRGHPSLFTLKPSNCTTEQRKHQLPFMFGPHQPARSKAVMLVWLLSGRDRHAPVTCQPARESADRRRKQTVRTAVQEMCETCAVHVGDLPEKTQSHRNIPLVS